MALAMGAVLRLGELLACAALLAYTDPKSWFSHRDEIKRILVDHLQTRPTAAWLSILEPADVWCAGVLTWPELMEHEGFQTLDMIQTIRRDEQTTMEKTRCPIRIDGEIQKAASAAPRLGAHTAQGQTEVACQ